MRHQTQALVFDIESQQKNSPLQYLINPKSNDTYVKLQY